MSRVVGSTSKLVQWWFTMFVSAVVIMGTALVMWPRIGHIRESIDQKALLTTKLEKMTNKETKLNSMDSDEVLSQLKTATYALPEKKPYYEVFANIQALAKNTGMVLSDFDLSPGSVATQSSEKVSRDGYIGLNTNLSGKGSRDQINAFLTGLYDSAPLIMVNNVSIGQSEVDLLPIKFDITMYYMPLTNPKLDPEIPLPEFSDKLAKVQASLSNYTPIAATTAGTPAIIDENRTDIFKF